MQPPWALAGRREDLRRLTVLIDEPRPRWVVIEGPAGVGRTRLLAEAVAVSRARGWKVHEIVASRAAGTVPFGAVRSLLRNDKGAQGVAHRAGTDLLSPVLPTATGRLLLAVDDAHLLDPGSAFAVNQRAADELGSVLLTLPTEVPMPDWLVERWKDGALDRVPLHPLPRGPARRLLRGALGGHIDAASAERILAAADDDLTVLRDLLEVGLRSGRLAATDGVWRWHGDLVSKADALLTVGARLHTLPTSARHLLQLVAIGEPLSAQLLEGVSDTPEILDLETRGLLSLNRRGRRCEVTVTRLLDAEVLRSDAEPLRTRLVSRLLADALQLTPCRRSKDCVRLAQWRLAAGQRPAAPVLAAAINCATAGGDHAVAADLACAAMDAGAGSEAAISLGVSLMSLGQPADAEQLFASVDTAADPGIDRTHLAIARGVNLVSLRRPEAADLVMREAAEVEADADRRTELEVTRASLVSLRGSPAEALRTTLPILLQNRAGGPVSVRAAAVVAATLAVCGRPERALAMTGSVLRAGGDQQKDAADAAFAPRWEALWFAGRLDEAESAAAALHARAIAERWESLRAETCFRLGLCAHARGRLRSAIDLLAESVIIFRERTSFLLQPGLAALAQSAAQAGEFAAARTALLEADQNSAPLFPSDQTRLLRSRAWLLAAQGQISSARAAARQSADVARAAGLSALEAFALHDTVRLGDGRLAAERFARLKPELDGALLQTMADHPAALCSGNGAALDEVAGRFSSIGAHLLAAEAALQASRGHRRGGRTIMAAASRARAVTSLGRCESGRTPALRSLGGGEALTPREREIVQLAAAGRASASIGSELNVSVRTVNNLLQRAYAKLGVSRRTDLAGALSSRCDDDD